MQRQSRIEITGKDEFWSRAFHVEWRHQFSDRKLVGVGAGLYLAEAEWMGDIEQVAAQTYCRVTRAPENPRRREWINSIIGGRGGR